MVFDYNKVIPDWEIDFGKQKRTSSKSDYCYNLKVAFADIKFSNEAYFKFLYKSFDGGYPDQSVKEVKEEEFNEDGNDKEDPAYKLFSQHLRVDGISYVLDFDNCFVKYEEKDNVGLSGLSGTCSIHIAAVNNTNSEIQHEGCRHEKVNRDCSSKEDDEKDNTGLSGTCLIDIAAVKNTNSETEHEGCRHEKVNTDCSVKEDDEKDNTGLSGTCLIDIDALMNTNSKIQHEGCKWGSNTKEQVGIDIKNGVSKLADTHEILAFSVAAGHSSVNLKYGHEKRRESLGVESLGQCPTGQYGNSAPNIRDKGAKQNEKGDEDDDADDERPHVKKTKFDAHQNTLKQDCPTQDGDMANISAKGTEQINKEEGKEDDESASANRRPKLNVNKNNLRRHLPTHDNGGMANITVKGANQVNEEEGEEEDDHENPPANRKRPKLAVDKNIRRQHHRKQDGDMKADISARRGEEIKEEEEDDCDESSPANKKRSNAKSILHMYKSKLRPCHNPRQSDAMMANISAESAAQIKEEDDDNESPPPKKRLQQEPILDVDEWWHKIKVIGNKRSEFREKLLELLNTPYSVEEYDRLLLDISKQKMVQGQKNLRGIIKTYDTKRPGKSYLDHHPDLKEKIDSVHDDHPRVLNLMRGFFYWLMNLSHAGAFFPWKDPLCLEVLPQQQAGDIA
ncbi:polyprotein [Quillaja saponaria]|uniref:Polyprotein n=1 Tax=Quillaja saponaria TaxID=32244 RepID=A0AAD7VCV4_QUISA|nr:polyprotein [Quillaja saponaria]